VPTVSRTLQLPESPATVWKVLTDFGAISAWAPNVDHSCLLSRRTAGVGTVRRIQTGRNTLRETVQIWEPDTELSYTIAGLPKAVHSVTNTWHLEPAGTRTNATLRSEIVPGPRPPHRLVSAVVARVLAKASEQMLGGLAAYLNGAGADHEGHEARS
jgi:uncharacterized protein YndB with AHSA1/START domain